MLSDRGFPMPASQRRSLEHTKRNVGEEGRTKRPAPKTGSDIAALVKQAAAAADMLKLMGNENRLLILCFLMMRGEMKAGELVEAVGLSQSALSQHLGKLRSDGLVTFRRQSQTLHYRISNPNAV